MRWNEIIDGDIERKDVVFRRYVILIGFRGRFLGFVFFDCIDFFFFLRSYEYLSLSVVKINLMRYRRSRFSFFFEEFIVSFYCLFVM